jgi:hypothetical protein
VKRKLEEVVREGESPDDLVLLLRGGPDGREKILLHAGRLEDIFTYHHGPARWISLFAAQGDLDAWAVLGGQLLSYPKYFRIPASAVAERFVLLPAFGKPHWILLLQTPKGSDASEDQLIDELVAIIGEALDNPKWVKTRKRRG